MNEIEERFFYSISCEGDVYYVGIVRVNITEDWGNSLLSIFNSLPENLNKNDCKIVWQVMEFPTGNQICKKVWVKRE